MEEKSKIQNILLVKSLLSTIVTVVIFLRLFITEIESFYLFLTVGISILVLPLVNFSLLYLVIKNYYTNTSITRFSTSSSLVTIITASIIMSITMILNSELISKINIVLLFLALVFLLEIPLSLATFPFLPIFTNREEISKQILISSSFISLSLVITLTLTQYIGNFSILDEIILIIVVSSLLLISLTKLYRNLYNDIEILKELISLQNNRKEEIITKELYYSMNSLENIITNQYSSTISIIKSINEIKKNISQIDEDILQIVSKIKKSKQKINSTKTSIEENIKNIDNTEKIMKTLRENLINYLKESKIVIETIKTFESPTTQSIDTIKFQLSKIQETKQPLENSIKNLRKSNEMLLSTTKLVPEVIENIYMFNNTIKELRKISVKINSTRVSFDVELRKSKLDKQNKDKLGVISKKIDELFLNLQESINSISFDEENFSIEENLKAMSIKTKQIQHNIEKFHIELQKLENMLNTIKFSLENSQINSVEIVEKFKEIEHKVNNIIEILKKHETSLEEVKKKIEETKIRIDTIFLEYEDMENLLYGYRNTISSVVINIPKFIEEIYIR